ncbi:MAG: hypothetical protein Q8M07_26740 [Prosthecobacter sp.]|nr:hypothetical protein [Prosthecobacter sp.]
MITDPDQMRALRLAQPCVSSEEVDRQIKAGLEATRIAKQKWLNSAKPKSTSRSPQAIKPVAVAASI